MQVVSQKQIVPDVRRGVAGYSIRATSRNLLQLELKVVLIFPFRQTCTFKYELYESVT